MMPVLVLASLTVPRHCATPGCLCSSDIFVRRPTRYRTRPGSEGTSEFCDLDYPTAGRDYLPYMRNGYGAGQVEDALLRWREQAGGSTINTRRSLYPRVGNRPKSVTSPNQAERTPMRATSSALSTSPSYCRATSWRCSLSAGVVA